MLAIFDSSCPDWLDDTALASNRQSGHDPFFRASSGALAGASEGWERFGDNTTGTPVCTAPFLWRSPSPAISGLSSLQISRRQINAQLFPRSPRRGHRPSKHLHAIHFGFDVPHGSVSNTRCSASAFPSALGSSQASSIPQKPEEKVDAATALNHALKASSLTFEGKPFHAVMEIEKAGETYSGRIEFWWVNASMYRVVITSPNFKQLKILNGDRIQENDEGDFYPRWLENFVLAVLDRVSMAKNLTDRSDSLGQSSQNHYGCLRRDDRLNGLQIN
jgi:hypothetical protein